MEEKYKKHLLFYGIDLDDLTHPLSMEIDLISRLNKPEFNKSIEHLIMLLIMDMEEIKKYNIRDYNYYLNKLKKKEISFWGERFEIYFYSRLISKLNLIIKSLRRGEAGQEADFIFKHNDKDIAIETTTLNFNETSLKKNPISKLKSKISEKECNNYSNLKCCLIIDITNLSFYKKIYDNFSVTISELFESLKSKFGAILLHESIHIIEGENLIYKSQVYDWYNPHIGIGLKDFLSQTLGSREQIDCKKIYLKVF